MIYKKILEITTKEKMIEKNNERIKEKQVLRKDERGHSVLEYQEE